MPTSKDLQEPSPDAVQVVVNGTVKLGEGWELTTDGTLWWYSPSGLRRLRGERRTCQRCGEEFAAVKSGRPRYCSPSCGAAATSGRNYKTRSDLFEHWTKDECYLAGLLWTDSSVTVGGSYTVGSLTLQMTDEDAVAAAAAIAGCGYRRKEREAPRKPIFAMQIGHRDAVARIADHGVLEPKTVSRPWPDLPHPASFLRGVFDGDGCVRSFLEHSRGKKNGKLYVNKIRGLRVSLCGSAPFLEGLHRFLAMQGVPPKTIYLHKGICHTAWAKEDGLRLADIMYSDPGPAIARKRLIFGQHDNKFLDAA